MRVHTLYATYSSFIRKGLKYKSYLLLIALINCVIFSCKKDAKLIPDNEAPYYAGIPTVKVENYINRLFIDLIGREALDTEMAAELALLRSSELSIAAREQLITKLQTNDSYLIGDSSYKYAYYNRFYEITKARMLEGVPDSYIYGEKGLADFAKLQDSLSGDSVKYQIDKRKGDKLLELIDVQEDYRMDSIDISGVYARMLDNSVYDQINMNTFNFVRASFSNLFFRFPTQSELQISYNIIEFDSTGIVFGKSAQNKGDYINAIVNSTEFIEGMVKWLYQTYLSREPSASETYSMLRYSLLDRDIQKAQKNIMKTDEYANF